jgi:DNA processing protein
MINDAAYWITFSHLPGWRNERINNLIIKFFHEQKISLEEFFQLPKGDWKNIFLMNDKEIEEITSAKTEISNNSFLAESLLNQGYEIIPITSPKYSKTLKENLKTQYSPAVIYIKGNKQILSERSIAIVGSRSASDISLEFTDNIAKLASRDYKVVVSGFAKGIDKQALDSAIKYKGQSIIVLPQGILTFGSGFKTYYRQIVDGDVIVLSTFFPKAPWSTGLAMARNPIIYGLANEIYVAESSDSGGTWSGVKDGLRKNRTIYIRKPGINENNANQLLIDLGAKAVDFDGNIIPSTYSQEKVTRKQDVAEDPIPLTHEKLKVILSVKPLEFTQIYKLSGTGLSEAAFKKHLQTLEFIEMIKNGHKILIRLKGTVEDGELTLF